MEQAAEVNIDDGGERNLYAISGFGRVGLGVMLLGHVRNYVTPRHKERRMTDGLVEDIKKSIDEALQSGEAPTGEYLYKLGDELELASHHANAGYSNNSKEYLSMAYDVTKLVAKHGRSQGEEATALLQDTRNQLAGMNPNYRLSTYGLDLTLVLGCALVLAGTGLRHIFRKSRVAVYRAVRPAQQADVNEPAEGPKE